MRKARVLVVDDEPTVLEICTDALTHGGYEVKTCDQGAEGIEAVRAGTFDLVLIDLMLSDIGGLELQRKIRAIDRHIVTVLITGQPSIETAVRAVKEGAFDYLSKPFSPDQLLIVVNRALQQKLLADENRRLRQELKFRPGFEGLVGRSRAMERVMDLVEKVADSDTSVVVEGETGTGKELIARSLHRNSHRNEEPFLPINCGALPEQLLESELFGHERGAFTGAYTRKIGLFEAAHGGTVFLDELSALGTNLQVKLLRALQERRIRRVGGQEEIGVDIRVISATNENLDESVAAGRFRRDLFYRLNVITISVPPLRERSEDIPDLANHFLGWLNQKMDKKVSCVSKEAMEALQAYAWPGNVRELQNVIERACLLANSEVILPEDLPARLRGGRSDAPKIDVDRSFQEAREAYLAPFETGYLAAILRECDGNVSSAAERAGMHRSSFQRLLRKYGIDADEFRRGG